MVKKTSQAETREKDGKRKQVAKQNMSVQKKAVVIKCVYYGLNKFFVENWLRKNESLTVKRKTSQTVKWEKEDADSQTEHVCTEKTALRRKARECIRLKKAKEKANKQAAQDIKNVYYKHCFQLVSKFSLKYEGLDKFFM